MLRRYNRRAPAPASAHRRSTQPLKVLGEDAAADLLLSKGFRLLVRNWRTQFGELDLIAMDGSTLVFVEVKARRVDRFVDPALGVDGPKQRRIRRLAEAYLAYHGPLHEACRFDVVSVITGKKPMRVRHIPNAF